MAEDKDTTFIEEEELEEKENEEGGEEKEPSKELNPEEIVEKNKQLFARAKKAEEAKKRLEAENLLLKKKLEELTKTKETGEKKDIDVVNLIKMISALKDYSPEELEYISTISKAKNISLEEAARSEEVQLYIQARREKVSKEKAPPPTSKSVPSKKPFSEWTLEDLKRASIEEIEEFRKWAKEQKG